MKKKFLCLILVLCMVFTMIPSMANPALPALLDLAEGGITIENGTDDGTLKVTYGADSLQVDNIAPSTTISISQTDAETTTPSAIVISADVTDGVNIKLNGVNIQGVGKAALEITENAGKVNLILADSSDNRLTGASQYAGLQKNNTAKGEAGWLTISCESADVPGHTCDDNCGKLTATGGFNSAGIGGGELGTGSHISIYGGDITATGGSFGGAGIGGGDGSEGSNISIYGGIVTTEGKGGGAGIGGGDGKAGSNINIYGGRIIATNTGAAGIGGGDKGAGSNINIYGGSIIATSTAAAGIGGGSGGAGSYINIYDGNITATGNWSGSGIGGGSGGAGSEIYIYGGNIEATGGTGIGGGSRGTGSDITISGGIVSATGGNDGGAAIGGGAGSWSSDSGDIAGGKGINITISGGTVTANSTTNAYDIGGGGKDSAKGDSSIIITGGNIYASSIGGTPKNGSGAKVFKATFSIPGDTTGGTSLDTLIFNNNNTPYSYGMNDTNSILDEGNGKLFVYLPVGTYNTEYSGKTYTAKVDSLGQAEFVDLRPAITAFNFNELTPNVTGTVDEVNKTIALTVPYGTNVTELIPTITYTGTSVSPNTGVAQNFTSPVEYLVTAEDGSTQIYTVTVSVYGADVNVQMNHSGNTSVTTNALSLYFQITNSSTTTINLSDVKLRYYYTVDGDTAQAFYCDSASITSASPGDYTVITGNVTGTIVGMIAATADADYYLEIGFNTAVTLAPGKKAVIITRVTKADWSNYNQSNDYSFNSSATQYVESDKIVLLLAGNNVSGVAPTAPRLTAGAIIRTSDTEATVKFTSDKTGEYYYEIVEDGATAPTLVTSGAGITCDITETTITNPTGLNAGAKEIYIVVKDATGDISIPIKLDIPAYVAPDATIPTITSGSCELAADNSYIDIMFSEGIYGAADGATALTGAKLALTFIQNGGTATNAVISSVKKTDSTSEGSASALTGGENTVRVFLTVTGSPNGLETIEIKPANSTSIYDLTGNAMLAAQTSGEKSLMDLVAPIATVQAISGTLRVGAALTGHYTYSDVNAEGTSTFKWYRADTAAGANKTPIAGATSLTYVLQTADISKYISFEVTPVAAAGITLGTAVESALTGPIAAGGGGGSGNSTPVPPAPAPVITVSEVKSELFRNSEDIKVEADVNSAFGQSVEVKITDSTESQKEIFKLAGAEGEVYPFDISLYSKESSKKVQPKDGYSVKITLPVPEKLIEDREQIKVVYGKDGKLETLKSELIEKDGKWYIVFEAVHFSPYALVVSAEPSVSWTNPFSDVQEGSWYYSAVQYVAQNGLMLGTGSNTFSPGITTNRGMIATILYRLNGSDETFQSTFKDVIPGAYYAKAVAWAQEKGIIAGYGNGMFGPEDSITREQMATILWRYAGSPVVTESKGLAGFKDAGEISAYAKDALAWIYETGIIAGKGNGVLDPKGYATRAEVAQIMYNFTQKAD